MVVSDVSSTVYKNKKISDGKLLPRCISSHLLTFPSLQGKLCFRKCWPKVGVAISKYNFFQQKNEMNGPPRHDVDVDCEKEPARQKVPHCKYKITITGASHGGPVCLSVSVNVLHLDNWFQIKSIPDLAQSVQPAEPRDMVCWELSCKQVGQRMKRYSSE